MSNAASFTAPASRLRALRDINGVLRWDVAFDRVTISLSREDLQAFRKAVSGLELRRAREGDKFFLAPSSYWRESGANWKTVSWISNKHVFGLRHGSVYWEASREEVREVVEIAEVAAQCGALH